MDWDACSSEGTQRKDIFTKGSTEILQFKLDGESNRLFCNCFIWSNEPYVYPQVKPNFTLVQDFICYKLPYGCDFIRYITCQTGETECSVTTIKDRKPNDRWISDDGSSAAENIFYHQIIVKFRRQANNQHEIGSIHITCKYIMTIFDSILLYEYKCFQSKNNNEKYKSNQFKS